VPPARYRSRKNLSQFPGRYRLGLLTRSSFNGRSSFVVNYWRTAQARPSGWWPALMRPVISKVLKSMATT